MDKPSSRRRGRHLALALLLLLAAAAALLWFFPARLALAWLAPRLHGLRLAQVSGLVWRGQANDVQLADGRPLGRASWWISRRVLWSPQPLHLQVYGPQLALAATVRAQGDSVVWDAVQLRADLALWRPHTAPALGLPRGHWDMHVQHAELKAGWPLQAAWQARWSDATLLTGAGAVALGDLDVRGSAQAGVIDAQLADDGAGPLRVTGSLRLTPLGWRLDAQLRARRDDPALRRWLATLGKPDAVGVVRVHRRGGLAVLSAADAAPAPSATVSAPMTDKP
jgi:general secretion pathway protein N